MEALSGILSEINIDATWSMLGGSHLNCYVNVPITSDVSFNALVRLVTANRLQM